MKILLNEFLMNVFLFVGKNDFLPQIKRGYAALRRDPPLISAYLFFPAVKIIIKRTFYHVSIVTNGNENFYEKYSFHSTVSLLSSGCFYTGDTDYDL